MDASFAIRLTDLRKSLGLSQKDAATGLGISQALLSHYEKGIRECGLGFIIKASDYYGVTCDFLLGKSSSKHGFNEGFFFTGNIPEDDELTTKTIYRVSNMLSEMLHESYSGSGDRYTKYCAISMYRVLIAAVNAGEFPKNWLGDVTPLDNKIFWESLSALSNVLLDIEKSPAMYDDKETPVCVKTLVSEMESFVFSELQAVVPALDDTPDNQ